MHPTCPRSLIAKRVAKGALGLEFVFTIMKDVSLLVC